MNLAEEINESGNYTFTVVAEGKNGPYNDSEVAESAVFAYQKPATQLATPTDLKWINTTRYWTNSAGATAYSIDYYKESETPDQPFIVGGSYLRLSTLTVDGNMLYTNDDWLFRLIQGFEREDGTINNGNGPGTYFFTVRALSPDITVTANSELSQMSPGNDIAQVTESINTKLNAWNAAIAANTTTSSAIRMELLQEDRGDLAAAMSASQSVVKGIATLEDSYKTDLSISTEVEVSAEAQQTGVASGTDISIIGAALNTTQKNAQVSLKITKSQEDYPLPDPLQYKNTVFLNMDLTGAETDAEGRLAVPVQIKMPVPTNITIKDNFCIIHYINSSASYETIVPRIEEENGTYYASFVLTHFSPFAFTEVKTAAEMNGDDSSNTDPTPTPDPAPSGGSSSGGFSGVYNYPVKLNGTVSGASVLFDKTSAVAGDRVTITVTPDTGRMVDEVIITDQDNNTISVTKTGAYQYSFTMPAGEVKVAVTTKAAAYEDRIVLQIGNRNTLVNNTTFANDVAPVIIDGRTMVPIRVITEALGGSADWNEAAQRVTLQIDGKTLSMTIGQIISGFDAAPLILNSRTYVPIRYVAEALGANVEWIAESKQ
ncbi:MAG: copper amine oxidase N-terminal domain-containing protein, partial [Peptococcaceae bacterium]